VDHISAAPDCASQPLAWLRVVLVTSPSRRLDRQSAGWRSLLGEPVGGRPLTRRHAPVAARSAPVRQSPGWSGQHLPRDLFRETGPGNGSGITPRFGLL